MSSLFATVMGNRGGRPTPELVSIDDMFKSSDVLQQEEAAKYVSELARTCSPDRRETIYKALVDGGVITALLRLSQSPVRGVQCNSLLALLYILTDDDSDIVKKAVRRAAVESLLGMLPARPPAFSVDVHMMAAGILAFLSQHPTRRKDIARADGAARLEVCARDGASPNARIAAATALLRLIQSPDGGPLDGARRQLATALKAGDAHQADLQFRLRYWRALGKAVGASQGNLVACGFFPLVVDTMTSSATHVVMKQLVMATVAEVFRDSDDPGKSKARRAAMRAGLLPAVLAFLRVAERPAMPLHVLLNLTDQPGALDEISAGGGIPLVIRFLASPNVDAKVAASVIAMGLASDLGSERVELPPLGSYGSPGCLGSPDPLTRSIRVSLEALAPRQAAIIAAGGVQALLRAAQQDGPKEYPQSAALALLGLSWTEAGAAAIASWGGIPTLVRLVRSGRGMGRFPASMVLGYLATWPAHSEALRAAGAIPALARMLDRAESDPRHERDVAALGLLGFAVSGQAAEVSAAKPIDAIMRICWRQGGYDGGMQYCMQLLARLALAGDQAALSSVHEERVIGFLATQLVLHCTCRSAREDGVALVTPFLEAPGVVGERVTVISCLLMRYWVIGGCTLTPAVRRRAMHAIVSTLSAEDISPLLEDLDADKHRRRARTAQLLLALIEARPDVVAAMGNEPKWARLLLHAARNGSFRGRQLALRALRGMARLSPENVDAILDVGGSLLTISLAMGGDEVPLGLSEAGASLVRTMAERGGTRAQKALAVSDCVEGLVDMAVFWLSDGCVDDPCSRIEVRALRAIARCPQAVPHLRIAMPLWLQQHVGISYRQRLLKKLDWSSICQHC